ncbi:DUF362 domain-containing protein, partial [Candidatus Bathyarchaeota archaeon]|nr:DUF362 domain-containing protein [Candidatus Bathyarchaeota archaeon]
FKEIDMPETIARSNCLISLAKLKTSSVTKISCALKNQFGCIPYKKKIRFHRFLDEAIVDANLAMRPHLSIVDGIIAHAGAKGPAFGRPVPTHIMIAGDDPVAVDSCCAKIFGFNPYFIGHVRKAAKAKIGSMHGYEVILKGFQRMPKVNPEFNMLENFITATAIKFFKKDTLG